MNFPVISLLIYGGGFSLTLNYSSSTKENCLSMIILAIYFVQKGILNRF